MIVLGIETSCDDTAVAVVDTSRPYGQRIIADYTHRQQKHEAHGGVVPELASRAHLINLPILTEKLAREFPLEKIDLVAATAGPGLIGGLLVGVNFAKALALQLGKPFIAVNHLQGHALSARIEHPIEFPYILLLTSGGHCQILWVEGPVDFKLLGCTIDDAAGEVFDKIGRMLGTEFPAGPLVEKLAINGNRHRFKLPRPMIKHPGCDFSFSGLKTAARQTIEKIPELTDQDRYDMAASLQSAIADCLAERTRSAIIHLTSQPTELVLGGGVAANRFIGDQLYKMARSLNLPLIAPSPWLCTDNGAMIAWAAAEMWGSGLRESHLDFSPRPRWPLEDLCQISQ